jgi:hypothetical protein
LSRTWFIALSRLLYGKLRGGKAGDIGRDEVAEDQDRVDTDDLEDDSSNTDGPGSGTVTPLGEGDSTQSQRHVATTKAGGRRRKNAASRRKGGK